jgi:hypothetical protein
MGKINTTRVILGGLVAGLIINLIEAVMNTVVLAKQGEEALAARNLPPIGSGAIAIMLAWGFALGIVTVWLYAALRPRFGAGTRTALIAGLTVWALAYVFAGVPQLVMGFFPSSLMWISFGYSLVEMAIASVAGAQLYREPTEGPQRVPAAAAA